MRFRAPARAAVDPAVFGRQPLVDWRGFADLIEGVAWPTVDALNSHVPPGMSQRFVAQTPALLADGLHYEQRIAERGQIATREGNWHDLFNALIWMRYRELKQALNRRQVAEIANMGPKQRSRAQYALTHFDEAGVIVTVRDPALLALWDAHDWYGLFWQRRQAWLDGTVRLELFGHALLELALDADRLPVGKALVFQADRDIDHVALCASAIDAGSWLRDPLDLRPLPLSGIPGWHPGNADESFHRVAACYQPRRAGRRYPPAVEVD